MFVFCFAAANAGRWSLCGNFSMTSSNSFIAVNSIMLTSLKSIYSTVAETCMTDCFTYF